MTDPKAGAFDTCEICGNDTEECSCVECPVCGAVGDLDCYDLGHIRDEERRGPLPASRR